LGRSEDGPRSGSTEGLTSGVLGALTGRTGAWIFTCAVAAAAVGVFVFLIAPLTAYDADDTIPWPVFVPAFALAEIAVVHLMIRSQAVSVSLSEIPLVIGFYYLAPPYLIVAQFLGAGIALVVHRHQPPLKLAFNLAIFSLASSLAILVFREVAAVAPTSLVLWWLASFLGTATVVAVSAVAISVVISISQRRLELSALGNGMFFGILTALVNTSVALVAVVFLRTEPDELWLLGAPAVVGLLGYRAFSAQRLREARLEFLYDCSQTLAGPLLDEATLVRVLQRTQEMFRAQLVDVVLPRPSGPEAATRVAVDRDGHPRVEVAAPQLVDQRRALLGDGSGDGTDQGGRIVAWKETGGTSGAAAMNSMIVSLGGPGGSSGTLLVAGHVDDLASFGKDDLRLLAALGSRLGLVVENSGLVERLATSLADASQLAAIVQSSEDAIVAVDVEGRVAAWNPAAEHLLGFRSEEVVGHSASQVLTDAQRASLREDFAAVVGGAVIHDVRVDWTRADGAIVPVSITMSPIRAEDGTITGASAIIRDESDRVRAEAIAAASTELLRTVIDGSPMGMGVAGSDHRWIRANAALGALLGVSAEEAIGRSTVEMIHPDDLATVERLEGRIFDGDGVTHAVERRYVDGTGRVIVAEVTARLLREPTSGQPVALYSVNDITERRRLEEQARSTEERFRLAALSISAVQDPSKVLPEVMRSARDVLQSEYAAIATYDEDGLVMTGIEVDGVDAAAVLQGVGRWPIGAGVLGVAPRLGRPIRIRDVGSHPAAVGVPGGHPRITSFLAVPIPHHGGGPTMLHLANKIGAEEFSEADETIAAALATHAAVCLDNARMNARALELVGELDRANLELTEASKAKSRFLASVAHELRTPLHAILVASELVHDPPSGSLGEEQVRTLGRTIESSGRHMVSLIDDLVDLSRIEAGHLEIRPTEILLGSMLAEVASNLAHAADAREIVIELPDGPGPTLFADPVRLRQILSNLLANALKFTGTGGRVWVDVHSRRDTTLISVHDSGIGIAPEDMERAFQPFEQVSRTSTPGAGLGLAISRSLAELHGGTLTATSEPGVGSVFTLALPRRTGPGPGRSAKGRPSVEAVHAGGGQAILVVEDDPTAMGLASDMLNMAGYEVWQARGLGEATALLAEVTPALALLDVRLGDGSGLDLVRALREDVDRAELPILVMSADAMPDDVLRARDAGCSDFLPKPVSPRALLERIHDLLNGANGTS
jgi:PAS domain S-box-containing protein